MASITVLLTSLQFGQDRVGQLVSAPVSVSWGGLKAGVMVNLMCQKARPQCPDIWSNTSLHVGLKMFFFRD